MSHIRIEQCNNYGCLDIKDSDIVRSGFTRVLGGTKSLLDILDYAHHSSNFPLWVATLESFEEWVRQLHDVEVDGVSTNMIEDGE